nr:hypothetical protein CFP56_09165 [Quercus suber]
MAFKRKRSSAAFSTTAISHIDVNMASVPFFYPAQKHLEPTYQKPTWSFPTYEEYSTHNSLNSRTRKRHRDDRPDEQAVYGGWLGAAVDMSTLADLCRVAANTMGKLYEAQRQHPKAELVPSQPIPTDHTGAEVKSQKTTLHRFWNIAQPPTAPPKTVQPMVDGSDRFTGVDMINDWESRCEDCDRILRSEDGMDLDDAAEMTCRRCRRRVCDGCAVTRDERMCLPCACR